MTDMTQAELDEAMGIANDYRDAKITGGLMGKLARAVLHLAARQMPALRWEGQSLMVGNIRLGGTRIDLGSIPWVYDGWIVGSFTDHVQVAKGYYPFGSQEDARTAVEAAVRKELGTGAAGTSTAYLQSEQRVGEGLTRDEIEAL